MKRTKATLVLLASMLWMGSQVGFAQTFPGWSFYNDGISGPTVRLADLDGNLVHSWTSSFGVGVNAYLLDDGKIIRASRDNSVHQFTPGPGAGGRLERIAWDGTVEWSYVISGANFLQHHDIAPLPNGNVLVTIWDRKTRAEAIAIGRDPATVVGDFIWSEAILEVEPVGTNDANIVWSWYAWDHMVQNFDATKPNFGEPADHPERIDINYFNVEENWFQANAIDYNAELDQIVVSFRNNHEVLVVSHAANSNGDILYRYGNPAAYGRGDSTDQTLFGSHNINWIKPGLQGAGNLLVFNNGFNFANPRGFSTIDEIQTPLNNDLTYDLADGEPFQPFAPDFSFDSLEGEPFFSDIMSSAQRLPNGNTFLSLGRPGLMYEIDAQGNQVWEGSTAALTFRAERIAKFDTRLEGNLWQAVVADNLDVSQGLLWSGGLAELEEQDDQYLEMRRNSGPIVATLKGTLGLASASEMNVVMESKHSLSTDSRSPVVVTRQVELFNYDSNAFEVVSLENSTLVDSEVEINISTDADRFLESGTGCVQVRMTFVKSGLARGMRITVDALNVRVVK